MSNCMRADKQAGAHIYHMSFCHFILCLLRVIIKTPHIQCVCMCILLVTFIKIAVIILCGHISRERDNQSMPITISMGGEIFALYERKCKILIKNYYFH